MTHTQSKWAAAMSIVALSMLAAFGASKDRDATDALASADMSRTAPDVPLDDDGRPIAPCSLDLPIGFDRATYQTNTWPGGVIPYTFNGNVSSLNQTRTLDAMAEIEAVSTIVFVPRTSEPNWIIFNNSSVNSSPVGLQGGGQTINMANWSFRFIIVHEIMHSLGIWHEQQRPDRNSFVQINNGNIQAGAQFNFDIVGSAIAFGDYDFDSVMHYDQCAFSTCGNCFSNPAACRTIEVLPPNQGQQNLIGQRDHLSAGDIAVLQFLYEGGSTSLPFFDDFPTTTIDSAKWTGNDFAEVNGDGVNPPSGTLSLNISGGRQLRSAVMDTTDAGFIQVGYWWQRTGNGNSPEAGEDLVLEYFDSLGEWVEVSSHPGLGSDVEPFVEETVNITDTEAFHEDFRIRFRSLSGSSGFDDWQVDDVSVEAPILPPNNDCLFSSIVDDGSNAVSNLGALSTGFSETCGDFESDVWFRYVATCDGPGTITASICDADFDTELAIYNFACPGDMDLALDCSDDDCGTGSSVSIDVTGPGLYRIRLAGKNGARGSGTLVIDCQEAGNPMGACCFADGSCSDETAADCGTAGGTYQGDGTDCGTAACPQPCPWDCEPPGGNGVVNFDDLVAVVNGISTQDLQCDVAPDNGDGTFGNGVITFDDILAVINNFGSCP